MNRVEFRLSMPSTTSWNGRWSGEGRKYVIVERLTDKALAQLQAESPRLSWFYRWDDGWVAHIAGRVMDPGERKPQSDGFYGYDWMVTNILRYGSPYKTGTTEGMAPVEASGR